MRIRHKKHVYSLFRSSRFLCFHNYHIFIEQNMAPVITQDDWRQSKSQAAWVILWWKVLAFDCVLTLILKQDLKIKANMQDHIKIHPLHVTNTSVLQFDLVWNKLALYIYSVFVLSANPFSSLCLDLGKNLASTVAVLV